MFSGVSCFPLYPIHGMIRAELDTVHWIPELIVARPSQERKIMPKAWHQRQKEQGGKLVL